MAVTAPVLQVEDLHYHHDHGDHRLKGISFELEPGELCCLLGPNGAGKTTLLRCLLGFTEPKQGNLKLSGEPITELSARQRARLVAYVPQNTSSAFPFTALDIAVMGRTPHISLISTPSEKDREMTMGVLEELGIAHLADRSFSQLSGGERQLTLIARALVQESPTLVLDEPTAALDYGNAMRILRTARELASQGRAVLMTTHEPDHVLAGADRALLLDEGRLIADGKPASTLTSQSMSRLYGIDVHVVPTPLPGAPDRHACVAPIEGETIRNSTTAASNRKDKQ